MTDTENMLKDSITKLLSSQVTQELLEEAEAGRWPDSLWSLLEQQGFTMALASESAGGSGLGWAEVFPMIAATGKYSLPLPLAEMTLATWLLGKSGIAIPDGRCTIAQVPAGQVDKTEGGWQLSGSLRDIPWADACDHIVVSISIDNISHVGLVSLAHAQQTRELNIAHEPRCQVTFAHPVALALVPVPGLLPEAVTFLGAMLRSAQMAGAAEKMLELTILYAQERVQFGRPLCKFQAIQQHIAVIGCESAAMMMAAHYAFSCADSGSPELAIMAAKIKTGIAAGKIASLAHAVHGAIGFTHEHQLHHYSRRLWSWRSEFGSHGHWSEHLGRLAAAAGPEAWWSIVTSNHFPNSRAIQILRK